MKYLSGTSKICQTKLTRDERLVLRWGDVLNFGSKTVELGSMGDNEMCREYKGLGLMSSSLLGAVGCLIVECQEISLLKHRSAVIASGLAIELCTL